MGSHILGDFGSKKILASRDLEMGRFAVKILLPLYITFSLMNLSLHVSMN